MPIPAFVVNRIIPANPARIKVDQNIAAARCEAALQRFLTQKQPSPDLTKSRSQTAKAGGSAHMAHFLAYLLIDAVQ